MDNYRSEIYNLWKTSWDNAAKSLTAITDQGQRYVEMLISQQDTLYEESKKFAREGAKNLKEAQLAYINSVNQNIERFTSVYNKK